MNRFSRHIESNSRLLAQPLSGRRRKLRQGAAVAAAVASLGVVAVMPLCASASAASGPSLATVQLQASLGAIPGVSASQTQALINDLTALANGGATPNLLADVEAVLGPLGQASGQPGLVAQVVSTLNGLIGGLLGGTPTAAQVAQLIGQLEGLAGTSALPVNVGQALADLASALTTADLGALLGQPGSPLSAPVIQRVLADLAALQSAVGGPIPGGALSGVADAVNTIAAQPAVPPVVADALRNVARVLASPDPIAPATLRAAAQTLAAQVPALQSVPLVGPSLGSLADALTTELANARPASGGNGGTGGSGGGAGATTNSYTNYVQYLQTPTRTTTKPTKTPKRGARIRALKYRKGHVRATITCPTALPGGCHTSIYMNVGTWRFFSKTITITPGMTRTTVIGLPHLATIAAEAKHGQTFTVTATTGTFTTKRTIHIHIKK